MDASDREPPSPYVGDPQGAYWSAERDPDGPHPDELDLSVAGDTLTFMWDYGVRVPLWDGNGLVPDEPAWLRGALGLSDALIEDLIVWGEAMLRLDGEPSRWSTDAYADLDRRAHHLVARLRDELPAGITVEHRPR